MATILGANIYLKGSTTKHNANPVGTVSNGVVSITGYDFSDVVAPGETFEAEFTIVYDNGTESAKQSKTVTASGGVSNTAPTDSPDSYSVDQDNTLTVATPGVLANASDADGDNLTALLVNQASNGTVNLASDGSFTYTPNAGYFGSDSFTYKANDGTADGPTTTVTITVNEFVPEAETTAYMNQIGITNDATLYNQDSPEQITGALMWQAHDKFVKQGKADGWYATGQIFLSERGDTFDKQKVNALNPTGTLFPTFNNGWTHNGIGSIPKNNTSNIEIPTTFASLGLSVNNMTVAAVELSNGAAIGTNDRYLFGNVDSGTIRVSLHSGRNKVLSGVTKDLATYTHNDGNSQGAIVATIQADNVQRTYKNGVKIGETASQNAASLPVGNIHLHSLNNLADYYSPQSASLYWIGTGLTDAQAISLSNALQQYATDAKITNDMVPQPVMYKNIAPINSAYWSQPMLASDWPLFTFSKPYWALVSSDHDSGPGGIYWVEFDDLDFNGLTYGGLIIDGTQSETPWIMKRPSFASTSKDDYQLYFQISGSPQVTKLITTTGGAAPHLCTWNDRGTVHPVEAGTDDNHLGYTRTYPRATDVIATHLGSTSPTLRQWISVSSDDGYSFTKLVEFDETLNMPVGRVYEQECMVPFTYNSTLHALAFTKDASGGTNRRLSIITLGTDYRCSGFVKNITGEFNYNTMNALRVGDIMHITLKNGGDVARRPNPYFKVKFDLTTI